MKNTFIRKFPLVSSLIYLILLFLPEIGFAELLPEEIIKIQDKIELKERDAKEILRSLPQKITDEWMYITSSEDFTPEKQAILVIVLPAIEGNIANYLLLQVPKEIGINVLKATVKLTSLILAQDPALVIEEFEKYTVEKAKEYATNWLLQNEIRVATGNLNPSYLSYKNGWEKITLPYIIDYHPVNYNLGDVGIGIYSSKVIKTPRVIWRYPWEGGIEELPPFIFRIKGKVQKTDSGYKWIEGPHFDVEFPEKVPEFKFSKPGFLDRIRTKLQRTRLAAERAVEKIKSFGGKLIDGIKNIGKAVKKGVVGLFNKIKGSISKLGAQVSGVFSGPGEKVPKGIQTDLEEMQRALTSLKEELDIERTKREGLEQKYQTDIAALIDKLDDLTEMVDTLKQKTDQVTESEIERVIEELTRTEELITKFETSQKEARETNEIKETSREEEVILCDLETASIPKRDKVIINEIAWMGTENSPNDEWIELKNISREEISLEGWQLLDKDGQIQVVFSSRESFSGTFFLLERTNDESVPDVTADKIYTGSLNDSDEALYLFNADCELEDEILVNPDWPAGDKISKRTIERKENLEWQTSSNIGGTPKKENSSGYVEVVFSPGGGPPPSAAAATSSNEPIICSQENLSSATQSPIIINEIAWMGTENSPNDEWIELKNISGEEISLEGWQLLDKDEEIKIIFENTDNILANSFYLLERTDDNTIPNILADKIYTGNLEDTNETLRLFDRNCSLIDEVIASPDWPAGDKENRKSMERNDDLSWYTFGDEGQNSIMGTPKAENSQPVEVGPPQVPILEVKPQSLEFTAEEFGQNPESQTLTINNNGSGSLEWIGTVEYVSPVVEGVDWLILNSTSGIAPSQVLVSPNISELSKGQYLAEIIIKTQSTEQIIEVILNIKEREKEEISKTVVINEIAWMGTGASSSDEWIELYNNTSEQIELSGWQLIFYPPTEGEPRIITFESSLETTTPTIDGFGYFLLERSNNKTVSDIEADYIYILKGGLNNDGGILELRDKNKDLVDKIDCSSGWFAGRGNPDYISMERINSRSSGSDPNNWANNNLIIINGLDAKGNLIKGTPRKENSVLHGLGTEDSPFMITNIDDLQLMNNNKKAWYELANNIDASKTKSWNDGKGFEPIGDFLDEGFTGHFNGNGYIIIDLFINRNDDGVGLFGVLGSNAEVKNVGLIDVDITGNINTGALAGYSYQATISNSYSTGTTNGDEMVGGLIGHLNNGIIENCYSIINVKGGDLVGGLVGRTFGEVTISNSYSAGEVKGDGSNIGGFIGEKSDSTTCENNFWDAQISRQVNSACAKGKWTSGMKSQITFINAGWDFEETWGIQEGTYPFLKNSSWIPSPGVVLKKGAGIENDPYLIEHLQDLQDIAIEPDAWYELKNDIDASETLNWNEGKGFEPIDFKGHFNGNGHIVTDLFINRLKNNQIGLFGWLRPGAEIKRVGLVNFNIIGGTNVGSLVGYLQGKVSNSYATGTTTPSVNGVQIVGGLIGHLNSGTIENSYSTARVEGNSLVGGLIGKAFGEIVCNNCFWDIQISGQQTDVCAEGKTTEEMKQQVTFVGWDFNTIWDIEEGKTYPFLRE